MRLPDPEQELVCCVSGGKDSTALALWLRFEMKLPNPLWFVFHPTGNDDPWTDPYLNDLEDKLGCPIYRSEAPRDFIQLAAHKKRFPSRKAQFCTEHLKIIPMRAWVDAHPFNDPVLVMGIRREESKARSAAEEWDEDRETGTPFWRPFVDWPWQDVFQVLQRHAMPPHPLYLMGFSRVGCWPCINIRKDDLRRAFELDPTLLPRLREWEARVGKTFWSGGMTPKRFHDRSIVNKEGVLVTYPSIDGVYRWALDTDQPDLNIYEEDGCVSRYGLCGV